MNSELFSRERLRSLIIPLIIEQTLAITVGMADTVMVASIGEEAMSGVSCVDTLVYLLIGLFGAMATGGAVVSAQFLGHKDKNNACRAAEQLILAITGLSLAITAISIGFNKQILQLIYKKVEETVMNYARTYFYIVAASFPFLAIYNAGAAIYRAMGNSKVSMRVSLYMNIINVVGNAGCLYLLHMEVEGVALATLVSRIFAAVCMCVLVKNKEKDIHVDKLLLVAPDKKMINRILKIGVPNGLENSVFQLGKILVQGIVSSFGTIGLAANATACTVSNIGTIPGSAIGIAMITVVGQCVGANEEEQMRSYTKKLMKTAYIAMATLNILVICLLNYIVMAFNLSEETAELAKQLILTHSSFAIVLWPLSFVLPNALRAANDVTFTMCLSLVSMWVFRIGFSFLLAYVFEVGVLGVWIAMMIDWAFRALCFTLRFVKRGYRKHSFV